ncbi:protein of unknown function DUF412 [Ferrimonas balearica DSM 9799]|uniref:UPF0208 membrane protein YfbV n=1 Tax=Ferrimonas balearica (strain DSM 9799 / CCM 4581 / KCTC 23876 / PAT) TaxID=550540 RepID=E1SPD8_FERBD|nr:terminus macrodomain insulation protein YfbV [Ferrimonas balearica]ADN76755.1 protein of unknown function DUF412 [Ferrimonas balearica DSM 9799]MBW3140258.1 DUF412 domain-containing protein [Ferrimonas balearica]MBW3166268.1 DUF412 domain-containing protein [Ferrimonas balearica]MBY5979858.1 DUF412 domain-containing protein [Ferrimonas balearica]MBY6106633.1 DUF412 domain-containing protein [Ferrimonas balearica]
MKWMTRLRQGSGYMKIWPLNRALAAYFPEYRVIRATRMAITWMPVVAGVSLTLQLSQLGTEILPLALAQAALILSLPLQGLYWLGWRSEQPLPLPLVQWCTEVREKLLAAGCDVAPFAPHSTYRHMASLLNRAYERLDTAFWREL